MKRNKKPKEKPIKQDCLTCYFEPDWSEWSGPGIYRRCTGYCKRKLVLPKDAPPVYYLQCKGITRYTDNSGIHTAEYCKSWKPKQKTE